MDVSGYFALDTLDFSSGAYEILKGATLDEPAIKDTAKAHNTSDPNRLRWWPYDWHTDATRTFPIRIVAATEALAVTAFNNLRAAAVPGAMLYGMVGAMTTPRRCIVYDARLIEAFDPDKRSRGIIYCTLVLTTYPYWVATVKKSVSGSITNLPGVITATSGVGGDVPALTAVKATCAQATDAIYLGLRSNPAAAAVFFQDYQGDATYASASRGGEAAKSSALTAPMSVVGTAQTLDTNAMRGTYAPLLRATVNAAAATSVAYGSRSSVTASGISGTTTDDPAPKAATRLVAAGFEVTVLPDVEVPAGEVPDVATGSGFGAEGTVSSEAGAGTDLEIQQGAASPWFTCDAVTAGVDLRSIVVKMRGDTNQPIDPRVHVEVDYGAGTVSCPAQTVTRDAAYSDYTFVIAGGVIAASTTVKFRVVNDSPITDIHVALSASVGSGGIGYHVLIGAAPLGFNSTIDPLALCTESSKYAWVDSLTYLPTDESAIFAVTAAAANQGVYVDWTGMGDGSRNAYLAGVNAGEIGPSVIGNAYMRAPFYLRPGDNAIVCQAATPGTAAPGAMTVVVEWYERFLGLAD